MLKTTKLSRVPFKSPLKVWSERERAAALPAAYTEG